MVDLDNVLVAMVSDPEDAEVTLRVLGFGHDQLRSYTSEQILEYDNAFRSNRGLLDRAVGSIVDDNAAMAEYVEYARAGAGAVWVQAADRDDASRVIRHLTDHGLLHAWFHGREGMEVIHLR